MTDKLDALSRIVDGATPGKRFKREDGDYYQGGTYIGVGPYRFLKKTEPGYTVPVPTVVCDGHEAEYFNQDICRVESDDDLEVLLTFDPERLKGMIAELKAGREMRRCVYEYKVDRAHIVNAFDKARAALDELLKGVEL